MTHHLDERSVELRRFAITEAISAGAKGAEIVEWAGMIRAFIDPGCASRELENTRLSLALFGEYLDILALWPGITPASPNLGPLQEAHLREWVAGFEAAAELAGTSPEAVLNGDRGHNEEWSVLLARGSSDFRMAACAFQRVFRARQSAVDEAPRATGQS